jgi:protein-disulfide isomerase
MAKRVRRSRRAQTERRKTNWLLVGGIVAAGAIALFALLFITLREQDSPQSLAAENSQGQPLAEFCEENPNNCIVKGSEDAPVTIVEVSDYGCSHCKDFNLETAGLLDDLYVTPGQVKWVALPYALGPQTSPASEAALCANEQEGFFAYHHRLFEQQGEPQFMSEDGFRQAAEDVGLDLEAFEACMDEGNYGNTVQQNIRAAAAVGVNSTPTFFINGEMIRGNQPLTAFQQQINALIGTADAGQ